MKFSEYLTKENKVNEEFEDISGKYSYIHVVTSEKNKTTLSYENAITVRDNVVNYIISDGKSFNYVIPKPAIKNVEKKDGTVITLTNRTMVNLK